jgi:Flp pilus assembly protein TadG
MVAAHMKRILKHGLADRTGASAVEFALVAPLFIFVLIGIVTFGTYFGMVHSVQQLASEAARASIGGLDQEERAELASAAVEALAPSYPLISPARLEVDTATDPENPDFFRVRLTYDASASAIWAFDGLVPLPSSQIERGAAIRRGGY